MTVICTVTATYRTTLQKTEATENVGKLSGDRNNNIQGDMPYTGSLYTGLTALSRHMGAVLHQSPDCLNTPKYPYLHKGISFAFRPLEFYREFSYSLDQCSGGYPAPFTVYRLFMAYDTALIGNGFITTIF